jgi:hypothetical protein
MRKAHGRTGPIFFLVAACAVTTGCKQDFVDQAFGVLDLSSTYDGGTAVDPSAGVPDQINPQLGYVDTSEAEYYDFGAIPVQRNPFTGVPEVATVRPIYFFYNLAGQPLFSAPVRELRDGTDWIKGGHGVLNPNPKDWCAGVPDDQQATNPCKKKVDAEKKKPYALRFREPLYDKLRKVNNYQRPIVDSTPADTTSDGALYTGLWEVIEVIVADGYDPDSIKHKSTLDSAVAAGKAAIRHTNKVINCPMIDERTIVARGVADRATPHPRIELWYRRQLTYCYLANGWETLGNDQGLILANNDAARLDTFDVAHLTIGEGPVKETRLVVPVSRVYRPAIRTDDQSGGLPVTTRVADNALSQGLPRHSPADPPGYSPIRWMWDFIVDGTYVPGGVDSVPKVDPSDSNATTGVRNMPLRGVKIRCSYPMQMMFPRNTGRGYQCGRLGPDPKDPTNMNAHGLDPTGDPTCNADGLECNPDTCFCDAPFVGYGQKCGPGIAQCNTAKSDFSEHGYTCLFPSGGYCYIQCEPSDTNTHMADDVGKMSTEFLDSRCKSIPGYRCIGLPWAPPHGICLKFCDTNVTMGNQCEAKAQMDMMEKDINAGQVCQDLGIEVCSWPDGFEPAQ